MNPVGSPWPAPLHSRADWTRLAHDLVAPALASQSPAGSEIRLAGATSWHGERADGLEAFARVFLLEALAGSADGSEQSPATNRMLQGIAAGVDPGPDRWIRASENSHALVEAASLCIGLWVGDHRLWRALSERTRQGVAEWLAECADLYGGLSNNWILFPFVISRFLASVGEAHPLGSQIEARTHERLQELYCGGGWYTDGGDSTFDYYNSFAFHSFPGIVAFLSGDEELKDAAAERLRLYLPELLALVSSTGAPVFFGRSMTYRFGVATPLSVAALLGVHVLPPSQLREVSARMIGHFVDLGALRQNHPLPTGWGRGGTDLVQDYSGPGASYWAAQLFTNLLLPDDHEYWAHGEPWSPPAAVTRLATPNFLVSPGTDGSIVRLANHGSFDTNVTEIKRGPDHPHYGRLAYSSATLPLAWIEQPDSTFTVEAGEVAYRRGRIAAAGGDEDWASSVGQLRDVRSGEDLSGDAGFCTLSYGDWDLHFFALPHELRARTVTVTFSGWAIDDPGSTAPTVVRRREALATAGALTVATRGALGLSSASIARGFRDSGPFVLAEVTGRGSAGVFAAASRLSRGDAAADLPPRVKRLRGDRWRVRSDGAPERLVTLSGAVFRVQGLGLQT